MGLIRKTASVFTVGLVDFKSDKERIATYTKGTRRAAKKGAKELRAIRKQGQPKSAFMQAFEERQAKR